METRIQTKGKGKKRNVAVRRHSMVEAERVRSQGALFISVFHALFSQPHSGLSKKSTMQLPAPCLQILKN